MNHDDPKINAVESNLRFKTLISGNSGQRMSLLARMTHYNVPGVSIAVVNQGQLEWTKAYGHITGTPDAGNTVPETLFQAASISKAVNAIGTLLLVHRGLLTLDEDVNPLLRSWKIPESGFTQKEKVTLRRLLSHSAGINVHGFPGYSERTSIPSIQNVLAGATGPDSIVNTEAVRVVQEPGSTFCYSGGGTSIIQMLIEDITAEPYDVWMQRNVLAPLGMHHSTFSQPLSDEVEQHAAHGHQANGESVNGKWHVYPEKAAAGLWTTPTDLSIFMIEIFKLLQQQPGLLHPALIQQAITQQSKMDNWFPDTISEAHGLGFFLGGKAENFKFAHDGGNTGFISRFVALPAQGKGFVIMVNNESAFGLIDEITHSIADIYGIAGFEAIEKMECAPLSIDEYAGFVGNYQYQDEELTITVRDGKLFLSFPYTQDMQLHRERDELFFVQESSDIVKLIKLENDDHQVQIMSNGKETVYSKIDPHPHCSVNAL